MSEKPSNGASTGAPFVDRAACVVSASGGLKERGGKDRWGLLDYHSLKELVRTMQFGARKYGEWNWEKFASDPDVAIRDLWEAINRHWIAYEEGESHASDSGCHHFAHIMANAMMMMGTWAIATGARAPHSNRNFRQSQSAHAQKAQLRVDLFDAGSNPPEMDF